MRKKVPSNYGIGKRDSVNFLLPPNLSIHASTPNDQTCGFSLLEHKSELFCVWRARIEVACLTHLSSRETHFNLTGDGGSITLHVGSTGGNLPFQKKDCEKQMN